MPNVHQTLEAIHDTHDWDVVGAYCEENRDAIMTTLRRSSAVGAQIVELTSFEVLFRLSFEVPSQSVFIPEKVSPRNTLARIIGVESARVLSEHFGSGALSITAHSHLLRTLTRTLIRDLINDGASNAEIARKLKLGARTVSRYINNPAPTQRGKPKGTTSHDH